jgi:hypothetical protein
MADDGGPMLSESRPSGFPRTARTATALGLLVLVAFASTSQIESGGTLEWSHFGLITIAVAAVALILISFSALFIGGYATFANTSRAAKLGTTAVAALLAAAFIALFFYSFRGDDQEVRCVKPCPGQVSGSGGAGGGKRAGGGGASSSDVSAAIAGGALLAALLVLFATMVVAERRRRHAEGEETTDEELVAQAFDDSVDDLRREHDVRRAIIACYARMERVLARVGSARRPAEAPLEYLARVLERITANGRAAHALTELFERAKFSVEPLGTAEKEQAIAALEELRMGTSS